MAPSKNLGLHLDKGIYLLFSHFYLGLSLLPQRRAQPCDHCGQPVATTSSRAAIPEPGDHNAFCGDRDSQERPADLLISCWSRGRDCAVDLTTIHNLNPTSVNCLPRFLARRTVPRGFFSAADWATDNRERLGFEKLALEVYLRFIWLRLSGAL